MFVSIQGSPGTLISVSFQYPSSTPPATYTSYKYLLKPHEALGSALILAYRFRPAPFSKAYLEFACRNILMTSLEYSDSYSRIIHA